MKDYLERMRELSPPDKPGRTPYKLYVDTSLPYDPKNVGAYFKPGSHIGISADLPMDFFVHEFWHNFYDVKIAPHFNEFGAIVREGGSLEKLLPDYPKSMVRMLTRMLKAGMPELAINESLAVEGQLRSLGWHRFVPGYSDRLRQYRIDKQLDTTTLAIIGTPAPGKEQAHAYAQRQQFYLNAMKAARVGAAALGAGGVTWYFFSEKGEMVGKDQKGNWVTARPAKSESELSAEDRARKDQCTQAGASAACRCTVERTPFGQSFFIAPGESRCNETAPSKP